MDFVLQLHNRLEEINGQVKADFAHREQRQRELVLRFTGFLSKEYAEPFAFKITCDDSNNPASVVEAGKVRIDVILKLKSDPVGRERHMWFD